MLLISIVLYTLSNAITLRQDKSIIYNRVALTVLSYIVLVSMLNLNMEYSNSGVGLYGGLFHITTITLVFQIFIFLISGIILHLTAFYPRKVWTNKYSKLSQFVFYQFSFYKSQIVNKMGEQFKIIEYPLIIFFILTGATLLVSTSDLISIFLSIELQSYGLYILCSLYRNSESATYGGLTYFLLGALSSCFILLGSALLYSNSGTTLLENNYIISSIKEVSNDILYLKDSNYTSNNLFFWYGSDYINNSLLILSIGFLFKVSAAPFHNWSPDVYDSIPTIVTTFVAIIAKISIFIFLLELVYYTTNYLSKNIFSWTSVLLISSLISLIIGSILGLTQTRIKRLFAYSTISHVGFILLSLCINSIESIQAFFFYLTQYTISNLNAFIILISIGFSLFYYKNTKIDLTETKLSPIQLTEQLKGYFYINPFLALCFSITVFSFVGIPPLIGFFAKQMVLSAAIDNGYIFIALIAILTSAISAVYYLNIIKYIFFDKPDYTLTDEIKRSNIYGDILKNNEIWATLKLNINDIKLSSSLSNFISFLTIIILLFMFISEEWLSMTYILGLILFNT